MVQKKDIVVAIILSFVTCGIYGIYWFITMTNDVAKISDDTNMSGGKAFLFSLITCGIYFIYWNYKIGKSLYEAGLKNGKNIADNSILYLILSIFGLSIVNYCLIQSEINNNWAA